MKLFVVAVLLCCWRLNQSSAEDYINIYPKESYFGGEIIQVILTCQPSQSCAGTVKWFKGTTEVNLKSSKYANATNFGNNYESLTISELAENSDEGTYHCQCTFNGVAVNSADTSIIYQDPVTFNTKNNLIYYAEMGKNVTLICDIEHYTTFQWQMPEYTVLPSNSAKYTYVGNNLLINNLTTDDDNRTYFCVGQNKITFVAKIAAHVFVYESPKVISTSSTEASVDEGDSITFNCTAEGRPLPDITWFKSGGTLKIGPTVIVDEGGIDKYSQWSSLTLTHISSSQAGNYLCSASSSTPKQSATQTATYTLTVNEPENPVFQIYTIDKSHSSINISWLLSGVSSNMINVSWNTDNGITHQVHSSNLSSIVLTDLVPDTLYLINAIVIGTDLFDSLNESTNQLAITSSSTHYPSTSTTFSTFSSSSSTFTTTQRSQHVEPTSTSNVVRSVTRMTSSTATPVETLVRDIFSDDKGLSPVYYGIVGIAVVLVVLVLAVVIVLVIMRRSRRSNSKNIRSIEKAGSSRSSQVLLEPPSSTFMSSPSIHSSSGVLLHPDDGSQPPSYFEGTTATSMNPTHSIPSYNAKLPMSDEFMYNTTMTAQYEPFEMTDNPNFEQPMHLSQVQPPCDLHGYYPPLAGDAASQGMASQSSNHHLNPHQFDYTDSTIYEMSSPLKKSQSEPPQTSSSNKLPVYSNQAYGSKQQVNSTAKKPEFGIVGNSQRGDVREHVVIKKR